jgi:hypothetical protein
MVSLRKNGMSVNSVYQRGFICLPMSDMMRFQLMEIAHTELEIGHNTFMG